MSHATYTVTETTSPQTGASYLNAKRGIGSWLYTVDHKRIGLLYLAVILGSFLAGGVLALLVRLKLWMPGDFLFTPDTYNKIFTNHGILMVFLVLIPGIPASLGNFVLPLQLGAKDLAFPKLNLISFYVYMLGAAFGIYSLLSAPPDTGWTFYLPYSAQSGQQVTSMLLAAFILGFSSIFTGINFIVTVHKLRAPGLTFDRLPLLVWALYATSVILVLATPVVGITLLLVIAERVLRVGVFDPAMGGDPILFQHFFWFYSHPAVYIMIVPGFGLISEIIATFSKKPIFGYRAVALSSIGIAIIGFFLWGHHMYTSESPFANALFSFLTFLVALPTAIKVFNWIATLYKSEVHLRTPMIYALCFISLFTIGGLTGLPLATLATDIHLHDTAFVVAHFHFVMVGGTLFAFIGGLHYFWPKMTGKMFNETLGTAAAIINFVGFNMTFVPLFLLGMQGMPRRYYYYLPKYEVLHKVSTIGAGILALGLVLTACCLFGALFQKKRRATSNPWDGTTLEWQTDAVPPVENFHQDPVVLGGPYDRPEK